MHIAILGGSFNPVHNGHLQIAKTALKKLPVQEVWFMPSKDTPLKETALASFEDRCELLDAAIKPYKHMKICKLEGKLEGISYTIHTVEELKKRYPQHSFCWLIGDDRARQFDAWKESKRLKKEVEFYVFSREGSSILPEGMKRVSMDLIPVSSTEIRQGKKLYEVPVSVRLKIAEKGLYFEETIRQYMNEKRYRHSLSVAQLCVALASAHNLNTEKAWKMGILHDICKQMPYEISKIWMRHHMPFHMNEAPAIWHGYIGADFVKRQLDVRDKDVISAIYHHVLGDGKSSYDKILFIADKLDPSRGYDSSEQIELCKMNLDLGFKRVKKEQQEYLRKEGTLQ